VHEHRTIPQRLGDLEAAVAAQAEATLVLSEVVRRLDAIDKKLTDALKLMKP
jgi:hypothetical protein